MGGVPILVDCHQGTQLMDLEDAERKLQFTKDGSLPVLEGRALRPVGIMPVHIGGLMLKMDALQEFTQRHDLWVVEDAAHAFPAAWRPDPESDWQHCGSGTADVTCYSFYANKTITTGEGGMAVTDRPELLERMRVMALHGLSTDAWGRYTEGGSWDYRIVAPGFKYNMPDLAAAIGIHQLERAEELRLARERVACVYLEDLASLEEVELPANPPDRIHAWHLFPIRLRLETMTIDRNQVIRGLNQAGVGTSVHWRPLHLHPYYEGLGWQPRELPVASQVWERLITLPLFPGMTEEERQHVAGTLREIIARHRRPGT